MDKICMQLDDYNKVVVHLHGATVISWISNNEEKLFVSSKAIFDNKKAIRGGIPVVFPQFGPWSNDRPQHGFARIKRWSIKKDVEKSSDSVSLSLSLVDDEETRKLWNHKFELVYEILLKENTLTCKLNVFNRDQSEFDFTCLLHTYLKVINIDDVKVRGLNNLTYIDKVDNSAEKLETNEIIKISGEVDRVYKSGSDTHLIDAGDSVQVVVKKFNFKDTVLWNPWVEKSIKMADFGDDEFKVMVCVEPGCVSERVVLKPNEKFSASQELIAVIKEIQQH